MVGGGGGGGGAGRAAVGAALVHGGRHALARLRPQRRAAPLAAPGARLRPHHRPAHVRARARARRPAAQNTQGAGVQRAELVGASSRWPRRLPALPR